MVFLILFGGLNLIMRSSRNWKSFIPTPEQQATPTVTSIFLPFSDTKISYYTTQILSAQNWFWAGRRFLFKSCCLAPYQERRFIILCTRPYRRPSILEPSLPSVPARPQPSGKVQYSIMHLNTTLTGGMSTTKSARITTATTTQIKKSPTLLLSLVEPAAILSRRS